MADEQSQDVKPNVGGEQLNIKVKSGDGNEGTAPVGGIALSF
jgi:hypothetical protein